MEAVIDFLFLGSKITADSDCSHEIERHLLLGRKAMTNYIPFEKLLLASDWTLIDTEQLIIDHTVILRPQVPIIQWVQSSPKTHRIGQDQEPSIIKWKWYIQDQAKPGPHGFTALHERISENLTKGLEQQALNKPEITELLVKWQMPFDSNSARKTACVV